MEKDDQGVLCAYYIPKYRWYMYTVPGEALYCVSLPNPESGAKRVQ